jgi:hypothetical protein
MPYLSGQLGTDQLGLAQLGQFEKIGGAPAVLNIDGSSQAPLAVAAVALSSGAAVSGGATPPLVISGAVRGPLELSAVALSAGAALRTPGLARRVSGGGVWPWQPGFLAFRMIHDALQGEGDDEPGAA